MKEYNTCELSQRVQAVKRSPRYSLMIALKKEAINAPFDGVTVKNSQIIEWISKDSSKPGEHRLAWLSRACMRTEAVCLLTVALHANVAKSTLERLHPCSFHITRKHLRRTCNHRSLLHSCTWEPLHFLLGQLHCMEIPSHPEQLQHAAYKQHKTLPGCKQHKTRKHSQKSFCSPAVGAASTSLLGNSALPACCVWHGVTS